MLVADGFVARIIGRRWRGAIQEFLHRTAICVDGCPKTYVPSCGDEGDA